MCGGRSLSAILCGAIGSALWLSLSQVWEMMMMMLLLLLDIAWVAFLVNMMSMRPPLPQPPSRSSMVS